MTSANYVKGIITIHTTNDAGSPHIDYNDIQNLTIQETENYGATGSVQLINDLSANTKNLLSTECSLWSDGTARKINRAMYLRVYHTSRASENAIGVFLITQITASDNLITLTFCDSVQYLRSIGADYVRNHFDTSSEWHKQNTFWDSANNCGVIQHSPSISVHGGSVGDVKFNKKGTFGWSSRTTAVTVNIPRDNDITLRFMVPYTRVGDTIRKIKINGIHFGDASLWTVNYTVQLKINGVVAYSIQGSGSGGPDKSIEVTIGENISLTTSSNLEIDIIFAKTERWTTWAVTLGVQRGTGGTIYVGGTEITDESLLCDITYSYLTTNVVGENLTTELWKINTVDGETITSDEYDPNWLGKAELLYVHPDAQIPAGTVFNRILQAYDFTCDDMQNTRYIYTFRCNGDCIHNYLLALADMPNGTTQFAFRSSKTVWNHIDTGYRSKNTDTSQKTIKYAKESGTGIDFLTFNPSISLKNNPRLAVAKGTDANDKPIMVALIDPNVPIGAMSTSVNASITTEVEGALACYSNIMTNRSQDWQGEITLSGIDLAYFQTGIYVGGVPVTVNDSRYGFTDYRAKVKEVKWDFANQKTTITINNYSEIYSNAILDTSKMAYSAGDMSAEASNDDMFVRQFVNIDATGMTSDGSTNDCWFYVDSGSEGHVTDAVTVDLPELNIRMVNAYFPQGNGKSASQYGVNSVKIGNRTHSIPVARRPDKYENQSLIVNVIYKLS